MNSSICHCQDVPEQAVAALRQGLEHRLIAVVLFGSRSRGDASADSDWDLLVIAEGLPPKLFERHLRLKKMVPENCRGAVFLLAKTPQEFEAQLPSLFLDIAVDGKILFDVRGYAAKHLSILRRRIEDSGLYRERTPAGDVWRWKEEPSGPWALEWDL